VLEQDWGSGHSAGWVGVRLFVIVSFKYKAFGPFGDKHGCPIKGDECVPDDRDVSMATFAGAIGIIAGIGWFFAMFFGKSVDCLA
jgi:hypothetical protein